MLLERRTAANGKCRATHEAARHCAAPVVRGGIYCALHADPERAAEYLREASRQNSQH
jgi:hypothetical protein